MSTESAEPSDPRDPPVVDDTAVPRTAGGDTSLLRNALLEGGALAADGDEPERRVACARCGRPARPAAEADAPALCAACATPRPPIGDREDASTQAGPARGLATPGDTILPGVAPPSDAPGDPAEGRFGRFRILRELGRGGMGVVFQAWDPQLQRTVALKLLRRNDDPEMTERFLREARASATLDHPGIVPIHEVNVHAGTPYYVMAFVDGPTLGDVIRRGEHSGMRARARLVREAAEAVAHAHARGVIHRDLKPSNILLDEQGRTHVVDFGLAKRLDQEDRLTSTGDLLGTPHYMPPEQLTGRVDEMGPASDVYALGVVLYEAVTGRLPFDGRTAAEVIAHSLAREPRSPRACDRRVPLDLETICLTALAKDPARRYPSAREFADDLDRFLAGEAISARREGAVERAWRGLKRRPGVVAAAGIAVLSLGFAAVSEWESARRRVEQERVEREFVAHLRDLSATNLDAALSLRRAGIGGDVAGRFLARLEAAAREVDRRAPGRAEPAYHLGRMYRALLRFEEAGREQDRALAQDPEFVPARYERAVLDAREYRRRLARLRTEWERREGRRLAESGALAEAGLGARRLPQPPAAAALAGADAGAGALRDRILAGLAALERRLGGEAPLPPGASPGMLPCARGLFLLYGGRDEDRREAMRLLEHALERDPFLEEAYEGLAGVYLEDGRFPEAEAVFTRGLEADRGFLPFRLGRGEARYRRGERENRTGGDPQPAFEGAAEDFTAALVLAPRSAEARLGRGRALAALADRLGDAGEDAAPRFRQAIDDLTAALAIDAGLADAWRARGWAEAALGYQESDRGGDPRERYARADADFETALGQDPESAIAHRERADLQRWWALYTKSRGEDPTEHYRLALAGYSRALELDPLDRLAWRRRAGVRFTWANWRKGRGEPGTEGFGDAEADLEKALELAPTDAGTWGDLGQVRLFRGGLAAERGIDPIEHYRGSLECTERALAANPASAGAWLARALANLWWAERLVETGEDPESRLADAEAGLERAQALSPRAYEVWETRAEAQGLRARVRERAGEDPGPWLERALADAGAALAENPQAAGAWMQRGAARGRRAAWRARQGEDAEADFVSARADLDRALAVTTGWDRVWLARARIGIDFGAARAARGSDPGEPWAGAAADLERALAVNPGLAHSWCARAELARRRAGWAASRGGDAAAMRAEAAADLERALALAPAWAEARAERARLRRDAGDADGARTDARAAARMAPRRADYERLAADLE